MLHTLYIVAHLTYCCTPHILLHTLILIQNGGHIRIWTKLYLSFRQHHLCLSKFESPTPLQVVPPVSSSSHVYRVGAPIKESGGLNLQFILPMASETCTWPSCIFTWVGQCRPCWSCRVWAQPPINLPHHKGWGEVEFIVSFSAS